MDLLEKVVKDTLHGLISLPPLVWRLIDTPEFQRLRHLKQCGFVSYVYPGAVHTRFEHCIGTAHLAHKMVCSLRDRQPELCISDSDVLCVTLAGLLHDIGHGPFSHTFERFVNIYKATLQPSTESNKAVSESVMNTRLASPVKFEHERISLSIIEMLMEDAAKLHEEQLKQILKAFEMREIKFDVWIVRFDELRLNPQSNDLQFIKDLVDPPKMFINEDRRRNDERYLQKKFLFEIVSNKWSGLDVDKLDYFARDSLYTGMRPSVDHERYIILSCVIPYLCGKEDKVIRWCVCPPGDLELPRKDCYCNKCHGIQRHICLPEKEDSNVFDIFQTRYGLFKRVYLHKVAVGVDLMFLDIMLHSESSLKIYNDEGRCFTLGSCALACMEIDSTIQKPALRAYLKLTDQVINRIRYLNLNGENRFNTGLCKARELLNRIDQRKHYRIIEECLIDSENLNKIQKTIEEVISEIRSVLTKQINENDFIIEKITFEFGNKGLNPFDRMLFFNKKNLNLYRTLPTNRVR